MVQFDVQAKKSHIFGYIIAPLLMIIPLVISKDPVNNNYTALINNNYLLPFIICTAPVFLYLCIIFYHLCSRYHISHYKLYCYVLLFITLLMLITPYHETEDFFSGLHVFLGYIVFILFNYLMLQLVYPFRGVMTFYVSATILAWLISLTFSSINGLSEIVYAIGTLWTITYLN